MIPAPLIADQIVDWGQLRDVAVTAFAVGVGIPAAFSVALLGTIRASDNRRRGHAVTMIGYTFLALAGAAVCGWAIYLAISTVVGADRSP